MGMHPTQTTQLAESLCAKLCHEMSGPLGTVAGALEMVSDDPETAAESLQLAQDAAFQMVRRLRLLRAAWGGDCGALDATGLAELASGLPPRIQVEPGGLVGKFSPPVARLLVNMLLLAVEALPRGGTISLSGAPDEDVLLLVSGVRAAWPSGLAQALADPSQAPLNDPRQVQVPLTAHLALEAGLRLSLLFPAVSPTMDVAPLLLTTA
jgi:histidine phosphotransferase ChpT